MLSRGIIWLNLQFRWYFHIYPPLQVNWLIFQCRDLVNAGVLLWLSPGVWWPLDGLVKLSFQTLNLRAGLLASGRKKKISHRVFTGKGGLAGGCHLISLWHVYAEIWVGNGKYAANLYHAIAALGCSVVIIHRRRDSSSSQANFGALK